MSFQQASAYYQPFYDTGTSAMQNYYGALQGLMQDPTALENQIMGSYSMSPWAQQQTNTLTQNLNRSAAMGGNLGTPNEQLSMANQLQGVVSKDQQQYLQNAMTPYMAGLSGEQYLTGQGMQAAHGLAGIQMTQERQEAMKKAMEAMQKQSMMGGLTGMMMGGLGDMMGGGSSGSSSDAAMAAALIPAMAAL